MLSLCFLFQSLLPPTGAWVRAPSPEDGQPSSGEGLLSVSPGEDRPRLALLETQLGPDQLLARCHDFDHGDSSNQPIKSAKLPSCLTISTIWSDIIRKSGFRTLLPETAKLSCTFEVDSNMPDGASFVVVAILILEQKWTILCSTRHRPILGSTLPCA